MLSRKKLLKHLSGKQLEKIFVDFTQYAKQARKDWQVPGVAIAIVKDNKIIYAKGFGVRNSKGELVTPETIFNTASLTKSFTAALLAKQIEEGKYSWDTKVQQLYPDFKLYDPKATQEFAIKDLVAHNSGLPDHALQNLSDFGYDQDYMLHALRFVKPEAPFRKKYAYQNIFLAVAQKIIEKTSGINYTANLHEKLFKPLSMQNSYTWLEDTSKLDSVAQPYFYDHGKVTAIPANWLYWQMWAIAPWVAAGGIMSSAIDIAKWLIFHMNNGAVNGKQLIEVANMNFMHAPYTRIKTATNGAIKEAYGEGWFINTQQYAPYTTLDHPGDCDGVNALMKYIPEAKIGIVFLTNQSSNLMLEALANRFFALYFNQPLKDWSKIELIKRKQNERKMLSAIPKCKPVKVKNLDQYVGTYNNEVYGDVIVAKNGDHLMLTIGPKKIKWSLMPCKKNIFKAYWQNFSNLDIPIFFGKDKLIKFIPNSKAANTISKMQVNYLNGDGSGVFIKK